MIRVPNLNLVILAGRLTAKPEQKEVGSGIAVANFSLAVNQNFKDSNGDWQEKTSFADITAWRTLAEYAASLKKGSPVLIQGSLQTNNWKDDQDNSRKSVQVVAQKISSLEKTGNARTEEVSENAETDEDLPF